MKKLGFTFYPQNWWDSDTYLDLPPELRYIYLEVTFKLYAEGGRWRVTQSRITKKFGVDVGEKGFELLKSLFDVDEEGKWSHPSVDKRLAAVDKRAETSRENGKRGGRPRKPKKEPIPNLGKQDSFEEVIDNQSDAKPKITYQNPPSDNISPSVSIKDSNSILLEENLNEENKLGSKVGFLGRLKIYLESENYTWDDDQDSYPANKIEWKIRERVFKAQVTQTPRESQIPSSVIMASFEMMWEAMKSDSLHGKNLSLDYMNKYFNKIALKPKEKPSTITNRTKNNFEAIDKAFES